MSLCVDLSNRVSPFESHLCIQGFVLRFLLQQRVHVLWETIQLEFCWESLLRVFVPLLGLVRD